jgi:hypothetical protein
MHKNSTMRLLSPVQCYVLLLHYLSMVYCIFGKALSDNGLRGVNYFLWCAFFYRWVLSVLRRRWTTINFCLRGAG